MREKERESYEWVLWVKEKCSISCYNNTTQRWLTGINLLLKITVHSCSPVTLQQTGRIRLEDGGCGGVTGGRLPSLSAPPQLTSWNSLLCHYSPLDTRSGYQTTHAWFYIYCGVPQGSILGPLSLHILHLKLSNYDYDFGYSAPSPN